MENASNYQLASIRFDEQDENKATVELVDKASGGGAPLSVDISLLHQSEDVITLRDIRLIASATITKKRESHGA